MESKKDMLLKELKNFVRSETAWLTRNDIEAIESKIDDLDAFINARYLSHSQRQFNRE